MSDRPPIESFFKKSPIQQEDLEQDVRPEQVLKALKGKKGDKGDSPSIEELEAIILPLIPDVKDGKDGKDGPQGPKGERGERGFVGEKGDPGKDGKDAPVPEPIEPEEITGRLVIDKINKSTTREKIKRSKVEGFDDVENTVRNNSRQLQNFISLGGTRSTAIKVSGTLLGKGIETLNFVGATGTKVGDGSEVNITTSGGTGTVNSVVAGTGISVDNTDPANPIVSATGSSSGFQVPTGAVDGVNLIYVYAIAPNAIVVDGTSMRKIATDGTVNWTGTTTITLTAAPTFDTYAVA